MQMQILGFWQNHLWLATGISNNGLYWSYDGSTWQRSNITTGAFITATYANGFYIAGSASAGLYTSRDGKTWTQNASVNTGSISSISFDGTVWYAGGGNGVWTTSNPIATWVNKSLLSWVNTNIPDLSVSAWTDVEFGNGVLICVCTNYVTTLRSTDNGATWVAGGNLPSAQTWSSLSYNNGTWIAVNSSSDQAAKSVDDGLTWTAITLPLSASWGTIEGGAAGNFAIITSQGVTENRILYTTNNGDSWTIVTLASTPLTICYGGGTWVAVTSNAALYSNNFGATWTSVGLSTAQTQRSCAYGGGVFVSISAGQAIVSSTQGTTWFAYNLPLNRSWQLAYTNGLFVAASSTAPAACVYSSSSGASWFSATGTGGPTALTNAITANNAGLFIALSTNSNLVQTSPVISPVLINDIYSTPTQTIVAEGSGTYVSGGIWRTTNNGNSFTQVNNSVDAFSKIGYDGSTYYASSDGGSLVGAGSNTPLWSSADAITWNPSNGSGLTSWAAIAMPSSRVWAACTSGRGACVAVAGGPSGAATNVASYSTTGGVSWIGTTLPSTAQWLSVAYGNGVFIAIAYSGATAYSVNGGASWVAGPALTGSSSWSNITFGNGVFIAVAYNGSTASRSTDGGRTWLYSTPFSVQRWQNVVYGGGSKFVAIAYSSNPSVAVSNDNGATWVTNNGLSPAGWLSLAYGNGVYVSLGYGSAVAAYSYDGVTWTTVSLPSSANWINVIYGNGMFLGIAGYDQVTNITAISYDGINWVSGPNLPASQNWYASTWINGNFISIPNGSAVGAISNVMSPVSAIFCNTPSLTVAGDTTANSGIWSTSNSGALWTQSTSNNQDNFTSIINDGVNFIALGDAGQRGSSNDNIGTNTPLWTSSNGTSWTPSNGDGLTTWNLGAMPPNQNWYGIAFGNGVFVAVALNTNVSARSVNNGQTWTTGGALPGTNWFSVCYGGGKFVAVSNSLPFAYSINNGTSWTSSSSGLGSAYWNGIAYGNGTFVAISGAGSQTSARSIDGINWIQEDNLAWWGYWSCIAFGNGVFVSGAVNGSGVQYSLDSGKTWLFGTGAGDLNSICYGNGKFVGVNGSYAAYSTDGITWTNAPTLPVNLSYIAYGNGMFVGIGYTSDFSAYSIDGINWQIGPNLPTVPQNYWDAICYGNGTFVVVPQANPDTSVAYSNILSPTAGALANNANLLTVAADGSGNSGIWKSSTNGVEWTQTNVTSGNFFSDNYH